MSIDDTEFMIAFETTKRKHDWVTKHACKNFLITLENRMKADKLLRSNVSFREQLFSTLRQFKLEPDEAAAYKVLAGKFFGRRGDITKRISFRKLPKQRNLLCS